MFKNHKLLVFAEKITLITNKSNKSFQLCKNIHITEIIKICILSANYVITCKLTEFKKLFFKKVLLLDIK